MHMTYIQYYKIIAYEKKKKYVERRHCKLNNANLT